LDVLSNLTTKFMRTYTMQVEALTNISVIEEGAGTEKMSSEAMNARKRNQQPVQFQTARMRSADEERETLPIASDEKRPLPIARRRAR
jgi:hypothetical protein